MTASEESLEFCPDHDGNAPRITVETVRQYVVGVTLPCKLCEGRLLVLPGGDDSGLTYRDDLGVVIPTWTAHPTARSTEEDESESYD